jgi:Domain of unknown function (DUF4193)
MSANPSEHDELEVPEAEESLEDVDEEELVSEEDEDGEEEVVAASGDEDEDGSTSLDELLAQRAAARRGGDDADDDDALMGLASEADEPVAEVITTRVIPMKDRQEFVCNRCHLVKAKSQLADPQRGLCRDCV